tara:strand:- start:7853 stop:8593 length:741 start_codon:yes stop_codon:yes gene_type:complete
MELSSIDQAVLILAAFLTSCMSAILGMGGGISLLAVMMQYLPQTLLIPSHGIVQLCSNGFRTALNAKHVVGRIFIPLLIGGIVGAFSAYHLVLKIPDSLFKILLPILILFFTWKPKNKNPINFPAKFYVLGFFSNLMSVVFGATGPLIAPFFLRENLNRFQIIATKAAIQAFGHLTKVIIYFLVGVSLGPYLPLIAMMIVAVFLGTFVGTKILHKVPEKVFLVLFKWMITLLCLRILFLQVWAYFN